MKVLSLALPALHLLLTAAPPARPPLVVRASPVASPCVAAASPLIERASGQRVSLQTSEIGPAASGAGADVVIAAQQELTRVIEGGGSLPEPETDLARIPWVLVGTGGAAPEIQALQQGATRVRVLAGPVGRDARQFLSVLGPDRVHNVRSAAELRPLASGEVALLPLSLAPPGATTATDVPPLLVQAVVVRASEQADAARAFVAALAKGEAAAEFRACGRSQGR